MNYSKPVSSLLFKFQKAGFTIDRVFDGEHSHNLRYDQKHAARWDAAKIICSVDSAHVFIFKGKLEDNLAASLFIVLGNDKDEIVADYSSGEAIAEEVEKIVEEFCEQWEGK